ncbi:transcriptional regulatory [Fusarium sporotrichioides]|uniref:Transcriptional regulatory n=1 Tax=Fusarium sporotrichioides TaxID=5514 RepID=A0A395SIF3_FUSSP|nr:transcriptional regulatory [Fusarium sporotrichioides]
MPRPKVRAEDRRRAIKACVPCQNSKKRCDSQTPCANCRRRDCIPYCIYDPEASRPRRKAHRRAADRMRDTTSSNGSDGYCNSDHILSSDVPSSIVGDIIHAHDHEPQTPESTQGPQSHATPDTTFSSFSMGDSPSLSFLDFLRHTFHHYMGPSPFTDKERAKAMLESVYPRPSNNVSPDSQLSLEEKRDYIQRFLIATTGIIYIYSPEQMLEMLEETEESRGQYSEASGACPSQQKCAIIDLAIAIGGQGCRTTPKSLYHAQKHFDRGQKLAFEEMLLDPTGDLVAIFLMMTIYMLNGCRRKGAFIYLGVATRLAHAIGLHLPESYNNLTPKMHRFRRGFNKGSPKSTSRLEFRITIEHEEMHSQLSDISGTETPGTRKLCRLGVLLLHCYAGNQTTPHILDALETATPGSIRYCLIFAAIPYQRS